MVFLEGMPDETEFGSIPRFQMDKGFICLKPLAIYKGFITYMCVYIQHKYRYRERETFHALHRTYV